MKIVLDFLLEYRYPLIAIAVLVAIVLLLTIMTQMRKGRKQAGEKTGGGEGKEKWYSGYTKYSWTIALALAGAIIFYVWLYTPGLRFAQVGEWSWDHWLALPAFVGILYVLITNCAGYLGPLAKTLQGGLVGAVLLMYLGIPAGMWVRDAFLPQVICEDVSARKTHSCLLNTAWSSWVKFADGPVDNGKQPCFTMGVKFERKDENGTTFWRFRTEEGRLLMAYRLYPGDQKCPATIT